MDSIQPNVFAGGILWIATFLSPSVQAGGATPAGDELVHRLAAVRPSPRQLAWQELEFTCFVHFGVNTFTGREWGTGTESPELFQPTAFDAAQWVEVAKSAGMRLVLLTAKHHDGFCLWPSRYTEHDVASSPWREGRGDVVRAVADACRAQGLEFGFYLSPADLHEIERAGGRYGNDSASRAVTIPSDPSLQGAGGPQFEFEVDDYNSYFLDQLYELLTEYGPVREVWFDGANPKPGTGQTYAYSAWYELIRKLAPDAVIAIKGPDVRWCGNEAGKTREAEWSVVPIGAPPDDWAWPDMMAADLGSRKRVAEVLAAGGHLHWYPAETNTSIRHGWFWRDEEQHVKSADEIVDVWTRSVGGNSVFLLNVPPNREGRFAARDVAVLEAVGETIRRTYSRDLAASASVRSTRPTDANCGADRACDGDRTTAWVPSELPAALVLELPEPVLVDRVRFQEAIATYGQRIESFAVDVRVESQWREVASGSTVGYQRVVVFDTLGAEAVRLRILESRGAPSIARITVHRRP